MLFPPVFHPNEVIFMICINIEFPTLGTKIQRPQAGIKGLGFFNAYKKELENICSKKSLIKNKCIEILFEITTGERGAF